jgi:hypothetical protein
VRGAAPDPFAPTSDPRAYVPREATERALRRLEEGLRSGRRVQVLSGPSGIGKTLLLHVLAERLDEEFRCLYLPYVALSWQELCTWVLGLLKEPVGALPGRELLAAARRSAESGQPLVLLMDEASALPDDSADGLAQLLEEAGGALRLLLVPMDDARAGRVVARLSGGEELRLSAPMRLEETRRYVEARLARSEIAPDLRQRFGAAMIASLHRASGGIPAQLHRLAGEVMRGNLDVLPGDAARRELGDPSDDDQSELEVDGEPASAEAVGEATAPEAEVPFDLDPPERASLVWIVGVNLAIAGVVFALLWHFGFIPPP